MQVGQGRLWLRGILAAGAVGLTGMAGAVTLGQADSFQGGSLDGWSGGLNSVAPPVVVGTGGPAGTGDGFLLLTSLGGVGSSSRLVGISSDAWDGNFLAAGVTGIRMDVNNLGATDLVLRLQFGGPAGTVISSPGVSLPSGSGWQAVRFSLDVAAFNVPNAAATLANVTEWRLIHDLLPVFPPDAVAATLGVDNVTAVPEPGPGWLLATGIAAMVVLNARRRQRNAA